MQYRKKSAWTCSILLLAAICAKPLAAAVHHSDAHVRHSLAQILSANKYRYAETNADSETDSKSALARIMEKIDKWISPVTQYVRGLLLATSAFAIAVYAIICIAIVSGMILLIRRLKPVAKRVRSSGNDGESRSLDYEREFIRSNTLAREGRFREAIQCCIKALWLFYHYKGYIRYMKDITNREYLALVHTQQKNSALEEIVICGETAIYGGGEVTRDTCENIHRKALEIISN